MILLCFQAVSVIESNSSSQQPLLYCDISQCWMIAYFFAASWLSVLFLKLERDASMLWLAAALIISGCDIDSIENCNKNACYQERPRLTTSFSHRKRTLATSDFLDNGTLRITFGCMRVIVYASIIKLIIYLCTYLFAVKAYMGSVKH